MAAEAVQHVAPSLHRGRAELVERTYAAVKDFAAGTSSPAIAPNAAAALRAPDLGERRAELRLLADLIDAGIERAAGEPGPQTREGRQRAEEIGHAWYEEAFARLLV